MTGLSRRRQITDVQLMYTGSNPVVVASILVGDGRADGEDKLHGWASCKTRSSFVFK